MDQIYVSKEDYEAWLELAEAKYTHGPTYQDCKHIASIKLTNGVDVRMEVTTLDIRADKKVYYGRSQAWNTVRLSSWIWENFGMTGKGSKSDEARNEVKELMSLLGNFEG